MHTYYKSPATVLDITRAAREVLRQNALKKNTHFSWDKSKFSNRGTSAESCALDSECHKGMGVGQSGNTLWRKYIFSRGLKEVKWRIYTEEKKKEARTSEGGTRGATPSKQSQTHFCRRQSGRRSSK